MTIDRRARSFDAAADAYERGRPDYPQAAVDLLVDALGVGPGTTVIDLAAGTGKLTRLLTRTGAHLVAVEPLAGMRAVLDSAAPGAEVRTGTAEHMPLPDGSADAVTVAQAFHWFDGPAALAEIHRVLRPGGGLGLVWNRRDLQQPVQAELDDLMERHRGDAPHPGGDAWREAFEQTTLFGPLAEARVGFDQTLGAERLVDRVLSVSFMAALDRSVQADVAAEVTAIARRHGGAVALHYLTWCYWCAAC